MVDFNIVGVVGGGFVGLSWISFFFVRDCNVVVVDLDFVVLECLVDFLLKVWMSLFEFGFIDWLIVFLLIVINDFVQLYDVDFVQENGLECFDIKRMIIFEIEKVVCFDVVIVFSILLFCVSDM